jgi:hypothetical protein
MISGHQNKKIFPINMDTESIPYEVTTILMSTSIVIHYVAHLWVKWNAYRLFFGKPEGKRLLGRPRRKWEDNIKMDLKEIS